MCLKLAALGKNKSSFKWYVVITIVQRTFSDKSELSAFTQIKKLPQEALAKLDIIYIITKK